MANWPIKIMVLNDTGDMAYSVSVQHVSASTPDTVTWSSETGPFTLSFQGTCPFNEAQGVKIYSTGVAPNCTAVGTVKAGSNLGCYYYSVAAMLGGKIYVDPGCPEIIIK